jgi:hypothetical protein
LEEDMEIGGTRVLSQHIIAGIHWNIGTHSGGQHFISFAHAQDHLEVLVILDAESAALKDAKFDFILLTLSFVRLSWLFSGFNLMNMFSESHFHPI